MDNKIYMPILKGKKGEFDALKTLEKSIQNVILPLLEVPAIPWDFVNDREASTIEKQITSTVKNIQDSWPQTNEILIDTNNLDENYDDQNKTINVIMRQLIDEGYSPIPVLHINASDNLIKNLVYDDYVCLRISFEDQETFDINDEINRIKNILNSDLSDFILLLDMNYISPENSFMSQMSSKALINSVDNIQSFHDFYFSSTSFPINLSGCKTNSTTEIERIELLIHDYLNQNSSKLTRLPKFSDYAISNPDIEEMDPRLMTISASIRYTSQSHWYIFKGASIKKHGSEQYYSLCQEIVRSQIYSGKDYSWGDSQIFDKSNGDGGPGNPQIWRKIGTNHHITFVVNQIFQLGRDLI